jgi:hypothetical protein
MPVQGGKLSNDFADERGDMLLNRKTGALSRHCCSCTPFTSPGARGFFLVILLASLLAPAAVAQTSPPPCTFLSAPGVVPAFCETFDQPAGTGNRSGDLNGTLWGVSRLLGGVNSGQGQWYDASPTMMNKCGTMVQVQPDNDVAICNGQVVESVDDQHGVTSLAMYPKQPFDFAGRTGTVAFDVSDDSHGSHRAWPEFWMSDKPVPVPFTHFSSLQQVPKDGFGVRFDAFCPAFGDPGCGVRPHCPEYPISVSVISVGSADVVNNYVTNDSFMDDPPGNGPISVQMVGCVKASSGPGDMNHFELRISPNEIDVYGVDAGATGPLKKIAVITNMTLTLTRGLVWLEDAHYNGDKDGPDQGTHTFTWDNLAFDGPVMPRDLAFDVPDRLAPVGPNYPTLINLGWPLGNDANPLTLMVSGVYNVDKAAAAILTFNYTTDLPITLSYKVNNGVWHAEPWPFPICYTQNGNVQCGSRTLNVPVPLSEVQTGTNTIQFKTSDSTNNAGISNVDLILVGAGGIVCTVNCPSTTAVTSSKNPSNWGDAVTFTATVTGSGGTGVPSGSVTFFDSSTPLGTAMLNGGGVATFTISALAVGSHMITATYGGDTRFAGSTGPLNTTPQVVNQAITTTTVSSSENPSNWGDAVTFAATVGSSAGFPSGSVTFFDSSTPLGTGTLNGNGIAMFTTSTLSIGNHTITAQYAGNTNFAGSTGPLNTNPQTVNKAVSATGVATSLNPSSFGQQVTFTAAVAAIDQGLPVATGTVTFNDGAGTIGSAALDGTGHASLAISTLSAGTHTITASYGGDSSFQPSSSIAFTQVVVTASGNSTSTALTVNGGSHDPIYFGYSKGERQRANFVVKVTGGTDGDLVLLLEGNQQIGPTLTLSSGQANWASQFGVGQYSVVAVYLGGNTAAGSTSTPQTFVRSPKPHPR